MIRTRAEQKRNEELIAFIKSKNDIGVMPSTRAIYESVDMAKETALKYLAVLRAKEIVESIKVGPSWLWYIAQDEHGNSLSPKIVLVQT